MLGGQWLGEDWEGGRIGFGGSPGGRNEGGKEPLVKQQDPVSLRINPSYVATLEDNSRLMGKFTHHPSMDSL